MYMYIVYDFCILAIVGIHYKQLKHISENSALQDMSSNFP
jgi:hypothetical protein